MKYIKLSFFTSIVLLFLSKVYLGGYLLLYSKFKIADIEYWKEIVKLRYDFDLSSIFSAIFVAPLLETIIFFTLVFRVLKLFKMPDVICPIVISVIFGFYHSLGGNYFLVGSTAITGFILACLYVYSFGKYNENKAFGLVFLSHSIFNMMNYIGI